MATTDPGAVHEVDCDIEGCEWSCATLRLPTLLAEVSEHVQWHKEQSTLTEVFDSE